MSAVPVLDALSTLSAAGSVDASATFAALRTVIRNPASNSTMSLLLLACAALVVLIVAIAVLMLVTSPRKKIVKVRRYPGTREEGMAAAAAMAARRDDAAAAAREPKPAGRLAAALTSTVAIAALIGVGIVGAYVATSTDSFCAATCHGGSRAEKTASGVDHSACVTCHEAGWLAVPANISSRGRMALAYWKGADIGRAGVAVDPHQCLGCHGEVTEKTTVGAGLRMSHKEVVAAGIPCTECHAQSGHTRKAFTATMDSCVICHDAKTASAECDVCHIGDPALTASTGAGSRGKGSGAYEYPAVRAASRTCDGCHDPERECDGCHGIRMPHTLQFTEGGHARAAAFDLKLRCWNCHDPQWCSNGGCHLALFQPTDGSTTHGRAWKQEHKRASFGAGCGCHSSRSSRRQPICYRCHDKDRSLLPVTY